MYLLVHQFDIKRSHKAESTLIDLVHNAVKAVLVSALGLVYMQTYVAVQHVPFQHTYPKYKK